MANEGKTVEGNGKTIELDNRGLQPPQPAIRILEALERMGPADVLVVMNPRRPAFLLPELLERGYACDMEDQPDGTCRLVIRRAPGGAGQAGATVDSAGPTGATGGIPDLPCAGDHGCS